MRFPFRLGDHWRYPALDSMAKWRFSPPTDSNTTLRTQQFTLRQFLALVAICSVAAFGYTWFQRAVAPTKFLNAAKLGDVDKLRSLAHSGVDIHYRDGWHTTALMMAASHGRIESVQFLLKNGADPNERSRFNATPLIWAAESGQTEIVKLLLAHGAIASSADDNRMTATDHALQNGYDDLASLINDR